MSTGESTSALQGVTELGPRKKRVFAFVDGFNLFHAIDRFDHGNTEADKRRYQGYKWLNLHSLLSRFIHDNEELIRVFYFTTYPRWDEAKRLRHQTYASAQKHLGVEVVLGEFKTKELICRASCKQPFLAWEEKQTDINIAVSMIEWSNDYDAAILVTADSDQVPTIKLLRKLHPDKTIISLPPIGRGCKELKKVCHLQSRMTESHLRECQLPNPIFLGEKGHQLAFLVKPASWPAPPTAIESEEFPSSISIVSEDS
jgi:uncharacterized LabA/DUF88 family protein